MDDDTERSARLFLERVRKSYPLSGALLFGSRARHDADAGSDLDIAVLFKTHRGLKRLFL